MIRDAAWTLMIQVDVSTDILFRVNRDVFIFIGQILNCEIDVSGM